MAPSGIDVFPLLFPEYVSFRAALRLSSTCREARVLLREALLVVARRYSKVRWRQVHNVPWPRHRLERSQWITYETARRLDPSLLFRHAGGVVAASPPTHEMAWRQLRTSMCRECLRPTRSFATCASGARIIVCRECSKDMNGYSCLVDRNAAYKLTAEKGWYLKKTAVDRHLAEMQIARRGGNRSKLYWKHAVEAHIDPYAGMASGFRAV